MMRCLSSFPIMRMPAFWTDKFPLYWTLFAIVGCFLLIKVGKGIAHLFLSKDEDFYG